MNFRFRLLLPISLTIFATLLLAYWLLTQSFNKKEGLQIENLALNEATAISQTLGFYTDELKKSLIYTHLDKGPMSYGPFLALTELNYENSKINIESFHSRNSKINRESFNKKLSEIPFASAEIKEQINFHFLELEPKKEFIFVFYKSKNSILGAFLKPNDLAALLDAKQTADHSVFVLANKTKAIVHPEKKYLGANVDNHPISQLALNTKHFSGVQSLSEKEDEKLVLSFETVPRTNLTVGIVHNLKTGGFISYLNWAELIMGIAILIIAMFLIFTILLLPLEKTLIYLRKSLNQLARGEPLTPPEDFMKEAMQMVPTLETLQNQLDEVDVSHRTLNTVSNSMPSQSESHTIIVSETEKYAMFKNLSLNLSQVISKPLNAMLGHLQMAKVGPDHASTQKSIDLAQTETRKLRSLLDDLALAVKEGDLLLKPVIFDDLIGDLLREKINVFNEKGIKIHKDFQSKKFIRSHQVHLEKALSLIINFFITNFSDQVLRDLSFSTQDNHNELMFRIQTNSDNLKYEMVQDLLEPYSNEIKGVEDLLSLTIANTLIKHMEGVIKVAPTSSGGVMLEIFFPVAAEHEVQSYIDEQKSMDDKLDDLSKDEVDSVVTNQGNEMDYSLILKHNHNEATSEELSEESFSGFESEDLEEDEFFVSPIKSKETQAPVNESSEPSIRLQDEDSVLEKESPIEFVRDNNKQQEKSTDVDLPDDDFVMVKPPKAKDIKSPSAQITDPYMSSSISVLSNRTPIIETELDMPEIPKTETLEDEDFEVNIRRPKLRSDN